MFDRRQIAGRWICKRQRLLWRHLMTAAPLAVLLSRSHRGNRRTPGKAGKHVEQVLRMQHNQLFGSLVSSGFV